MRNYLLLLKIRIRKTKATGKIITALLYAAGLFLFYELASMMAANDLAELLPLTSYLGAAVLCFIAVVLSLNETFSGEDDSEYLLSTPIPSVTQVLVMFTLMYLKNVVLTFLIEAPFYVGYRQAFHATTYGAGAFVVGLLLTCMPICGIATLVGMFVLLCLSSSPRKNRIMSGMAIVAVTLAVAVMLIVVDRIYVVTTAGSFAAGETCEQLITELTGNIRLARFYQLGIVEGQGTYIFLFGFMSFIWYAVFLFMHTMSYQVVITALNSPISYGEKTAEEVLGEMRQHSAQQAQLRKEFTQFFGSKSYLTHSAVGMILGLEVSLNFWIMKMIMAAEVGQNWGASLRPYAAVVPACICIFVGLCNTTYCAYSMERKESWILDSMPIDSIEADRSKMTVGLCMSLPTALLCGLLLLAVFEPTPIWGILYVLIPVAYAMVSTWYGLAIGRRFADTRPTSEQQILRSGRAYLLGYLPQVLLPAIVVLILILL